jgi:endonuclease/exonuclease/phosphatase (EEP) superfamily protein YafD
MTRVAEFIHRRIRILIVLGLSATWVGLFGDLWWPFDLFAHFRWQYVACCVFAIPWFVWAKSRVGVVISVVSLLLNVALLLGFNRGADRYSSTDAVIPEFRLRVVSINVHTSNRAADKVLDFVRQSDADMVFLMEVDDWWADALAPLKKDYPQSEIEWRGDNFGVAFFSRIAGTRVRMESLGEAGVPTVVAELQYGGKNLQFIGTHPVPPTGPTYSAWRNGQLGILRDLASTSDRPTLLVGDLNATPWSSGMRTLMKNGDFRLPPPNFVWSPTWMARSPLAISIDHALATPPLVILRRDVGPDVGSDHRPIVVEVGWAE